VIIELKIVAGSGPTDQPLGRRMRFWRRTALNPDLTNPLPTLQTLTFSAIPALRITSSGLVDVKSNRRVDFLVEA
jgi:adenine deaminase